MHKTIASQILQHLMDSHPDGKLTPTALAKKVNGEPPQATIFRILKSETKNPRKDSLAPIADFFNIPVNVFFSDSLDEAKTLINSEITEDPPTPALSRGSKAESTLETIMKLDGKVTDRSRRVLAELKRAAELGVIDDDDWTTLERMAKRFEK